MLNRMIRLGSTCLGGERATISPRIIWPAQRFRNSASTFAAVRNHQPESNLALENHSPRRVGLQAAVNDHFPGGDSETGLIFFARRTGESGRKCL
jgi:hypothetical protein